MFIKGSDVSVGRGGGRVCVYGICVVGLYVYVGMCLCVCVKVLPYYLNAIVET